MCSARRVSISSSTSAQPDFKSRFTTAIGPCWSCTDCSPDTYGGGSEVKLNGTVATCCAYNRQTFRTECSGVAPNYCAPAYSPLNPCIPADYCVPGSALTNGKCQACPENTAASGYGSKNICTPCTLFQWAYAQSTTCTDCTPGWNLNMRSVTEPGPGWRVAPGKCQYCPATPNPDPKHPLDYCPVPTQALLFNASLGFAAACCYYHNGYFSFCTQPRPGYVPLTCVAAPNFPLCELLTRVKSISSELQPVQPDVALPTHPPCTHS